MTTGRRGFLSGVAAALAAAHAAVVEAQRRGGPPIRGPQFPDASGSSGSEESQPLTKTDPRRALREEQKELRKNVDRLLQMVKELKEESDKTPETDILSLSLVKKAEDIEKLARQIKEKIRSS